MHCSFLLDGAVAACAHALLLMPRMPHMPCSPTPPAQDEKQYDQKEGSKVTRVLNHTVDLHKCS